MFTAFAGHNLIAEGDASQVAAAARVALAAGADRVVIFEDDTGRQVELDLRGPAPVLAGVSAQPAESAAETPTLTPGRGRPKLGVVAREITLLPRHWSWLNEQPGGASAALRRLIDDARRTHAEADDARRRQHAVYGVMSVLAGDLPDFETASRALFAGDDQTLATTIRRWPQDIAEYLDRQRRS